MKKKLLDWGKLGFNYLKTDWRYIANYENGHWEPGIMSNDDNVTINESAGILQYCQEIFEGLKARETKDGKIIIFRPDCNAKRMIDSAIRMEMPPFPEEQFLKAVKEVVCKNEAWIPPYGSNGSLYIRPYMFATSPIMGVKPAAEYQFRIFCSPVGPYFKSGIKPLTLRVSEFDRAAPFGTGQVKAGLNYAMSMHAYVKAHNEGYDENVYLDPATHTYIEETGGANIIFITKEGKLVTPKSNSILPSITKNSLLEVAKNYYHMEVSEEPVLLSDIGNFQECGLCGTAAVISPVGKIVTSSSIINFPSGMEKMGPVLQKLYDTLTQIQNGEINAPEGWLFYVK